MQEKIGGVILNYQFYKGQDLYSDGPIEDRILEICKQGKQKEALEENPEWPILYHFSSARKNILDWYPIKKNESVLEIGAGCGAITGVLSKKAKKVVCIELSKKRSLINAYQNQSCDNVEIYVGKYEEISLDEKFDYITLIGVLEYAASYTDGENPYQTMLEQIKTMLNPGGKILIAIENKLGLKYWCGAPEDHTGVPFEGMHNYESEGDNDRYGRSEVRTFSRQTLMELFHASGYREQRFYYPLPDYKFPSVIFSDEYLPKEDDIRSVKFYYPTESELIADERKLYGEVIQNNSFPFFSNSFFVEVSEEKLDNKHVAYASYKRDFSDKYKVVTTIWNDKTVTKQACTPQAVEHIMQVQHNAEAIEKTGVPILMSEVEGEGILKMPYSKLPLTIDAFNDALKRRDIGELKRWLDALKDCLKKSSSFHYGQPCNIALPGNDLGEVLDIAYLDMLFINAFNDDGKLLFFDQEWVDTNIPLKYIMYRAIKFSGINMDSVAEIKENLYLEYGIDKDIRECFDKYEEMFLADKMDSVICEIFDSMMYHEGLTIYPRSRKVVAELYREKDEQRKKLDECNENIEKQQGELNNRQIHIEQLLQSERDLTSEVNNKKAHIEQLMQSERDLNEHIKMLHDSKAFRLMQLLWKINAVVFPMDSTRRKIARRICHPFGGKQGQKVNGGQTVIEEKVQHVAKRLEDYDKLIFTQWEKPLVSIVIPVYNEFDYTYGCLDSILKNSGDISYEVIIADDCSTDLTKDIEKIVSGIVVSKTEQNVRFLLNCNQAAKKARGQYILFLNNDTKVHEQWLEPLVSLMESDETIGMTGSKLVYADGSLQEAGGIIWKDGSGWNYGNRQDASLPEFNYVKEVDYISGAAIMIRADLWREIGGFDERYVPAYCEDSDLAFEVRKHGYRVMYQPKSVVTHFEGISNGTDLASGVKQYQVENSRKLQEKWKDEFAKQYPNAVNVFCARERSGGKKTILVIDHYVPQFDKDAGSRTVYQYLKMLVSKGYIIKFVGDNFYRHEPYTSVLQQMGIEVLYGAHYAQHIMQWIRENKEQIACAFLNRPHISEKYIDVIHDECGIKTIYYGHDLHFLRIKREYELTGDAEKKAQSKQWLRRELKLMRQADVSYYPSYIEEEEIHKMDASINVKAITAYVFDEFKEDINYDASTRKNILFVGGFRHDPNVDAVLWFADKIWPMIYKETGAKFYIVGSHATEKIQHLDGKDGIEVKGFVSDEELNRLYAECRLVVVPLRYGAGVKGKVVEALYNGSAIVTTSVGAEGIRGIEKAVIVEDEPEAFAKQTIRLYQDDTAVEQLMRKAQELVREQFGTDAVWEIIADDFPK